MEEEKFREAACIGDIHKVREMINEGSNVNAQNKMNGWSALHWASKRGHHSIIKVLVENDAKLDIKNNKGETAADIAKDDTSLKLLNAENYVASSQKQESSPFVPNYIKYPIFPYSEPNYVPVSSKKILSNDEPPPVQNTALAHIPQASGFLHKVTGNQLTKPTEYSPIGLLITADTIIFNVRIHDQINHDFHEIVFPRNEDITFEKFVQTCLQQILVLDTKNHEIKKVVKLPNVIIKNNCDIKRLTDYQYIDIYLS